MYALVEAMERDSQGKFVKSPGALESKTIGLRLHRSHYQRFFDKAAEMGRSPTELARDVIEEWLDRLESQE